MKENKFQKSVKKYFENKGAFVINHHGHAMQRSGLPDLQIIHLRWKGWLELKVEKNKASTLQRVVAAKIGLRGMPVYVLRCVETEGCYYHESLAQKLMIYTLEDFEGGIITEINDLNCLLNTLIGLDEIVRDEL